MKPVATRNRDGSYSVDGARNVYEAMLAISQFHIDAASIQNRAAKVARESRLPAIDQARAEIAAEKHLAEAAHWMRHGPSDSRRPETYREVR